MSSNTTSQDPQSAKCSPVRFKTSLCRTFSATGNCPYANRCMFAHGGEELRTPEMNVREGITTHDAIRVLRRKYRRSQAVRERNAKQAQAQGKGTGKGLKISPAVTAQNQKDECSNSSSDDEGNESKSAPLLSKKGSTTRHSEAHRAADLESFIVPEAALEEDEEDKHPIRLAAVTSRISPQSADYSCTTCDDCFGASDSGSAVTASFSLPPPERWYRHDPYAFDAIDRTTFHVSVKGLPVSAH